MGVYVSRVLLLFALLLVLILPLPGGVIADSHDGGREDSSDEQPAAQPTSATSIISVGAGGSLGLRNVSVRVPAGVVTGKTSVTARLEFFQYDKVKQPPPEGLIVGTAFELTLQDSQGAPVTQLAKPLSIKVAYTAQELADAGGDPKNIVMGILDPVTSKWEQIPSTPDPAAGTVSTSRDHLTKFTLLSAVPPPQLSGPVDGALIYSFAPLLEWNLSPSMAQYHLQVIPFGSDGPGLDLIRNAEQGYQMELPKIGVGNYILLPGMTYTWRIRTSAARRSLTANEPYWSSWSEPRTFKTPVPVSWGLRTVMPVSGGTVNSTTPTLQWADQFTHYFYYEVQVSRRSDFGVEAFLYWELRHGGATTPINSYAIPKAFPLELDTTYYWRVRPRVQGDGAPIPWSESWNFKTPAKAG